jgi:hypothetical protein
MTRKETHIKFYKAMAVPTFMYGSEMGDIIKKQKQKFKMQK